MNCHWKSTSYAWDSSLGPYYCLDNNNDIEIPAGGTLTFDIEMPATAGTKWLYLRAHMADSCEVGSGGFKVISFTSSLVTAMENNPPYPETCGIDVIFVLDESDSIASEGIGDDVRAGAEQLWQPLQGTGSTLTIVEFNTVARVTPVLNLAVTIGNHAIFDAYIDPENPGTVTPSADTYAPEAEVADDYWANWEDAFDISQTVNSPTKDLLIYFTAGVPTTNNYFPNNQLAHTKDPENNVDLGSTYEHTGPAAAQANVIKNAGTRVLGLGFGVAAADTLPHVSGPTKFVTGSPGSGETNDLALADWGEIANITDLADALRDIVGTAQEAITDLVDTVQGLVDGGALAGGNGNALISKLENAIAKLDQGKPGPAIHKLEAFIDQVNSLVDEGKLAPGQGQALVDAAQRIIDALVG